jgi:hypothetical protein
MATLVQAVAESGTGDLKISKDHLREALAAIAEVEKTELLLRIMEGDSHVAVERKSRIRNKRPGAFCAASLTKLDHADDEGMA